MSPQVARLRRLLNTAINVKNSFSIPSSIENDRVGYENSCRRHYTAAYWENSHRLHSTNAKLATSILVDGSESDR